VEPTNLRIDPYYTQVPVEPTNVRIDPLFHAGQAGANPSIRIDQYYTQVRVEPTNVRIDPFVSYRSGWSQPISG
jgi:hypothetical protein